MGSDETVRPVTMAAGFRRSDSGEWEPALAVCGGRLEAIEFREWIDEEYDHGDVIYRLEGDIQHSGLLEFNVGEAPPGMTVAVEPARDVELQADTPRWRMGYEIRDTAGRLRLEAAGTPQQFGIAERYAGVDYWWTTADFERHFDDPMSFEQAKLEFCGP